MKFARITTKGFRKDLRRLQKSGYDLEKLETAIDILVSGEALPLVYFDHSLQGELKGRRECHIGPDWLLVYKKDRKALILLLLRTGTHRDTFGIE